VKQYFDTNYGLRRIRIEESIDDDVNWRPTISGSTSDHHLICIEVTDGGYTAALDHAVAQLLTMGLPLRLFIAYPGDDIDPQKILSTFHIASNRGIGIVEVRARGRCTIQKNAIDLSLAAVHRTDPKILLKKYRQAFMDAEATFLNGDPAKGCARVYDEIEALTRKFAAKAANLSWWNPGRLDLERSAWARILGRMIEHFGNDFRPIRRRCPDMTMPLLNGISGLTGHRNESGHKPGSRKALMTRDAQLRTRFEHARDIFVELQDSTRPLRI